MTTYKGRVWGVLATMVTFSLVIGTSNTWAFFRCIEFTQADVFFEENTTDEDIGFHFDIDGEGWNRIVLFDSRGRLLVDTTVSGGLQRIGLTQVAAESAEPGHDEIPRDRYLARFPEGTYALIGLTINGRLMVSYAEVTKQIPVGAELVTPVEDAVVDPDADLVIEWESVPDPNPPSSTIQFYEVVVEKEEEGALLRVFSVIMLADETTVSCPAAFLEPGKDYKVEIISEETSRNRSSIEVPFSTSE